jgi:hypothetical protein
MAQFLFKGGDLDWKGHSRWVFSSPSVEKELPDMNAELLSLVHANALNGAMTGVVETREYTIAADRNTESDLYYAMFRFLVWAEADYQARLLSCNLYLVKGLRIYRFSDDYDWHKGLAAGGDVAGVAGFKDDWAAALHDNGLALEFRIKGHQKDYFLLIYPENWLDPSPPSPLLALPRSLAK